MQGLSILEIITIIAAFQLMMLGVVLVSKASIKKQSNRILSLFMFSNSILLIYFLVSILGIYELPIIAVFYFLLGPLIYLYVKSMCVKNFSLQPASLLHFALFAGVVIYLVVKAMIVDQATGVKWYYLENLISQIILHIQIALYITASLISIHHYRKEIKNHYSSVEKINLSWLLLIIIAFTAMWLTDLISFIINILIVGSEGVSYYLVMASITINLMFANYLVYRGLHQPDAFSGLLAPGKYSGSKISDEDGSKMVNQLKDIMQNEKPYLNPDLTIKDLSEHFDIHPKFLSQIINSQIGHNFYDFVNYYRIEEAKMIMTNNTDEKMTILEILYEVGFNSKSAFNNAFKKNTGKTPSEYKSTG